MFCNTNGILTYKVETRHYIFTGRINVKEIYENKTF
jgi:hypothetical protein